MLLKILRKIRALDGVASLKTQNLVSLVNCSIIHNMQMRIDHINIRYYGNDQITNSVWIY